jgi:ribosomal protein S18 acetylase RimI-like enzyme
MNAIFEPLQNVAWRSLMGAHRAYSIGGPTARRYARGYPPIAAVAEPARPDVAALRALAAAGETIYLCDVDVDGRRWAGFELVHEAELEQLAGDDPAAPAMDAAVGAKVTALTQSDVVAMQRLIARTRPGPFGPRSPDLGVFAGVFAGGSLVAMAGTRMTSGGWVELSAVCTDPAHEGRGLASVLVWHLQRRVRLQGRRLFLHVDCANKRASSLYRRLGFVPVRRVRLRVLRRDAA